MSRFLKFILSFVIFVAVCAGGLTWFINSEVEKGLNEAVAGVEGLTLDYADISVDILGRCVTLDNVEATLPQGQHLIADRVNITAFDQINPIPHFLTADARGVSMDASLANVGDLAMPMQALNIPVVKGDLALDYKYDPSTMTLDLKALTVRIPKLCDAKLSGTIDKLDLQRLRVEKAIGLRIDKADLTITNHSIVDTLISESARGLNTTKADALTRISAELTAMADYAGNDDNTVAEEALRELRRYLNAPGTMTLSAHPVEPVPVLYFFMGRDLYDNLRMMNVTISSNSSEDI